MAFFPRQFHNTPDTSSFTPLFRLLDDFDTYNRQGSSANGPTGRRSAFPSFQPKFDIRETGDVYELHGELPGMTKENVQIEFPEPQTMHVRGKIERSYTAGTPPAGHIKSSTSAGALTEGEESTKRAPSPHQATVEDEGAENDVTTTAADTQEVSQEKTQQKPADTAKYWLAERSIGEFSRTFNFPSRVDQDGVSASLKDGILTVSVPKAKKHESRRIAIQ